jgi:tetratricopeptide (TPR) repeat protein
VRVTALTLALAATLAAQAAPASSFDELARRAREALDAGRLPEAAEAYARALAARPRWVEGAFNLGGALYELRRFPAAVSALERATFLAPKIGLGWALLGLSEAELDRPQEALAHLMRAESLGLDPNLELEIAVRLQAARLFLLAGSFDEAYLQFTPLVKRAPDSPELLRTLGLSVLAARLDAAKLDERQETVAALAGWAAWETLNKRPEESAAAYKRLFAEFEDAPGVHYAHGSFLVNDDVAGAAAEFEREIAVDPAHWPSMLLLAPLQAKLGRGVESVKTWRRAMALVPARLLPSCHLELGRALFGNASFEDALKELLTAQRAIPDNADVHFQLSQVYRRIGKQADAQRELAEFQRLKSQQGPLYVPTDRK